VKNQQAINILGNLSVVTPQPEISVRRASLTKTYQAGVDSHASWSTTSASSIYSLKFV